MQAGPAMTGRVPGPREVIGLASRDVAPADLAPAQLELIAHPDPEPPEPGVAPTFPTNPIRGAPGHQVPDAPDEDEDDEGNSLGAQLFEYGARQAEADKESRAARVGDPNDWRESNFAIAR